MVQIWRVGTFSDKQTSIICQSGSWNSDSSGRRLVISASAKRFEKLCRRANAVISYSQQSAADRESSFRKRCYVSLCWVRFYKRPARVWLRGSHGGVAVEADVQVVLQGVDRVPGQPLQQHVVETLHQSTLHTRRRVSPIAEASPTARNSGCSKIDSSVKGAAGRPLLHGTMRWKRKIILTLFINPKNTIILKRNLLTVCRYESKRVQLCSWSKALQPNTPI